MDTPATATHPRLVQIAEHLAGYLRVDSYPDERSGVLKPSDTPVRRIGVALDTESALSLPQIDALDALLLHRWWSYESLPLKPSVGVLGYHLPFDHRLTLGDNPRLAARLGMADVELLYDDDGKTIGMIGDIPASSSVEFAKRLGAMFDGLEHASVGSEGVVRRIAVVNAMTASRVREGSARGADVYVTGQVRKPAEAAVQDTGIGVIAVGHARAERFGLRLLEELLWDRWAGLEVHIAAADL